MDNDTLRPRTPDMPKPPSKARLYLIIAGAVAAFLFVLLVIAYNYATSASFMRS
jgi:hypothetical protein